MKLFIVHRKNVYTNYKQSLCSFAAVFVIIVTVFSVIVPFYITFSLYHDTWPQQKIIYEQPDIQFKYNYIFLAEHINIQVSNENLMENVIPIVSTKSLACNSYKYLIDTLDVNPECSIVKVILIFFIYKLIIRVYKKQIYFDFTVLGERL